MGLCGKNDQKNETENNFRKNEQKANASDGDCSNNYRKGRIRKVAPDNSRDGNEEDEDGGGGKGPGSHINQTVAEHHQGATRTAPLPKPSPAADERRRPTDPEEPSRPGLPSNILARVADMCESGEFGRYHDQRSPRRINRVHVECAQDLCEIEIKGVDTSVLERRDEAYYPTTPPNGAAEPIRLRSSDQNDEATGDQTALSPSNRCPSICGCRSTAGKPENDYASPGRPDTPRIRDLLSAFSTVGGCTWYSNLPSAEYPLDPSNANPRWQRNKNTKEAVADTESWTIHAPEVPVTRFCFPQHLKDLLGRSDLTLKIFQESIKSKSVDAQLKEATCTLSRRQLKLLINRGIIKRLDPTVHPDRILFVGNVFLHAEPLKHRWRLIFHPALYNEIVRRLKLHHVDLPRSRRILSGVNGHRFTIKIDLKCAFFQVPIEDGLFCFRHSSEIYSLCRLPMGASVSVSIAQALSTAFANTLVEELRSRLQLSSVVNHAFVDDIFVSFSIVSNVDLQEVERAMKNAACASAELHNVTLKTFQYFENPTGTEMEPEAPQPRLSLVGKTATTDDKTKAPTITTPAQGNVIGGGTSRVNLGRAGTTSQLTEQQVVGSTVPQGLGVVSEIHQQPVSARPSEPSIRDTSRLDSPLVCPLLRQEELEVLGVIFNPGSASQSATIRMKPDFKAKALQLLNGPLTNITCSRLWQLFGTCFHVIYSLNMSPARHFGVFRIISKIARQLEGASKFDPKWSLQLNFSPSETSEIETLLSTVRQFPTVNFHPFQKPSKIIFTDASNVAAGAVCYDDGYVSVASIVWNAHERLHHINTKEVFAAWIGIRMFFNPKVDRSPPLLAVDNTTAFFRIISAQCEEHCACVVVGVLRRYCNLTLVWTPTDRMPADALSRLLEPTWEPLEELVRKTINSLGRYYFLPQQH